MHDLNQSINLHEHVPKHGGCFYTHNTFYSSQVAVINCYTYIVHVLYKLIKMKRHNPQNSSVHLFLGLCLGLFPATCPFFTLFTRLPSFSIIFSLHNSLLLTCATTASCFDLSLIASFLTPSNHCSLAVTVTFTSAILIHTLQQHELCISCLCAKPNLKVRLDQPWN